MARILRGDIRWAELNPVRGRAQAGRRPVLVLSHDVFNERSGTVIAVDRESILVACGNGTLALKVLQKPGGKALPAAQFVQGFPVTAGDRFGAN